MTWMRTQFVATLAVTLGCLVAAPLAHARDDDRKAMDKRFVKEAAEYLMVDNDVSRMARDQSSSEGVRHYAELAVGGQRKLLDELRDIAHNHDFHIPEAMTDKQHDTVDRLRHLKNDDFDVEYMSEQREDLHALVDLFEKARHDCDDKNLREFADRKVDMLKEHRDNAEELYRKVKEKRR